MFTSLANFAVENCIKTSLFGEICDDCHGGAIFKVITPVVTFLANTVIVVAIIGIIVAGIIYMTSAGNVSTQAKAKSRLSQIIVGLVILASMNALLQWLLPGGYLNPTSGGECPEESIIISTPTSPTTPTAPTTPANPTTPTTSSKAELLAKTAVQMAWPYESGADAGKCRNSSGKLVKYSNSSSSPCKAVLKEANAAMLKSLYGQAKVSRAQDCSHFVSDIIAYTGVDKSYGDQSSAGAWSYLIEQAKAPGGKWVEIPNNGNTKNLKPGDVFVYPRNNGQSGHVMVYVGSYGYGGNTVGASLNKWVARTHNVYYTHEDTGAGTKFKIFRLK